MASQASIEGICCNGLAWKIRGPRLAELCKRIGGLRTDDEQEHSQQLVRIVHAIASQIDKWLAGLSGIGQHDELLSDFERLHREDIELMHELTVEESDDDYRSVIEEVVYALEKIYDTFDYERVLVR